MKKFYEEPVLNIARFTLKDALLKESDESQIGVDGDDGDKDPGDILG